MRIVSRSPVAKQQRCGLTLMELVVVLAILATLAAVLVPMFPNFLRRANKATDATNIGEIAKALQLYQAQYLTYPIDFDLLTDGTGLVSYLPSTSNGPFDQIIVAQALTSDQAKALNKVGITRLQPLATTVSFGNATQNPYPTLSPATDGVAVASGLMVAVLNTPAILAGTKKVNTDLYNVLASDTGTASGRTPTYMVVGVGSRNSAVGRTMVTAPVAMPQGGDMNPTDNYCRYGAVFKIDGDEIALTKRARLVCVIAMEEDEIETIENEVIGFTKVQKGEAAEAP